MAKVKNDFSSQQETQPIDSLPSSPSDSGDELGFIHDTEPFEDDAWINDEYVDTQVMDIECDKEDILLCGETQALDLGFETQEEPFVEGKQLLEASDGLVTQVVDRFDDEVVADTDDDDDDDEDVTTIVLEDNGELSANDDSHSKGGNWLSGEDKREHADEMIKSTEDLVARTNEHGNSGKVAGFASVRSAAFRACAVAATLKFPNGDCFKLVNSHPSGQGATRNSGLDYDGGEVRNQLCPFSISVEKKDDLQKGKKTARKLFLDDLPEDNCPSVGLSYIDSQEPGEASQANALNLVDKLISESCLEFALGLKSDCGRGTEEKSKFVPSVKGPQELANKISYKDRDFGGDAFDWDDNREDEGGGDICRRRKEELFGVASKARKSSTLPREQKREVLHESHRLGVAVDKRRAHSDSRLVLRSVTRSRKKIQATKKNLGKELDKVSEGSNNKVCVMRELVELGYDTQVAADAINALQSGDDAKFDAEASCRTGQKLSPGEERGFSNCGVITRPTKGTKRIQAMGKDELLKRGMKKASPISTKACLKNVERSSKDDQLDKEGPSYPKKRKVQTASRETKKNPVDEFSKESNTRMFDRHEEVEAGPDTQMAAEAINALRSGDGKEIDCVIGKKLSTEEKGVSSRGVGTRKSKRINGIHAVDNDLESLKPKTKKARSTLSKACEKNVDNFLKNDKLDMPNEVVVSSTVERRGELSNKDCTSKPLKQSSGGEAEVLSYPKRRRSARISQDKVIETEKNSDTAFDTPVKSKMPSKIVSPICMGDEYHRLSCTNSFKSNTTREFRSLTLPLAEPILEKKSTRKRRDLGSIRVLFSQHLDEDVVKHQKKILARFDISEASSMSQATHFIADNFMRTRNMLEAIASGKPVVTTQWLESINQVNIYVDEDLYILRDSKKENEFGFNMGVSLARARQYPLLQGKRVFITPNTKPGLNTITTLVKAVHGLPVERIGRSALSEAKIPKNLLVLSCEDDRDICIPFIERGAEVYSSELLLNGIVTQKLEYERYRLFADNVRRTRSTNWIRDGKGEFQRHRGVNQTPL